MINIKNHTEMFKNFRDIRDSKARELKCSSITKYGIASVSHYSWWCTYWIGKECWIIRCGVGTLKSVLACLVCLSRVFGSFFLGYRLSAGYLSYESDFWKARIQMFSKTTRFAIFIWWWVSRLISILHASAKISFLIEFFRQRVFATTFNAKYRIFVSQHLLGSPK